MNNTKGSSPGEGKWSLKLAAIEIDHHHHHSSIVFLSTTTTATTFQLFSLHHHHHRHHIFYCFSFHHHHHISTVFPTPPPPPSPHFYCFPSNRFYKRLPTAILSSFCSNVSCSEQQSWFSSAVSCLPCLSAPVSFKDSYTTATTCTSPSLIQCTHGTHSYLRRK